MSQTDYLPHPPLDEQIRRRAYELWLQRGGQDGSDVLDWLLAEEEIQGVKKENLKMAQEQQIRCKQCGKMLNSQEELRQHEQTQHQAKGQGQQSGGQVRGAGGSSGQQSGQ